VNVRLVGGTFLVLLAWSGTALAASRPVALRAADGVAIAATVYEAPASPAPGVVLVHMLTRTKDWRPFAERLQSAGLTALALDLRGHGQSEGSAVPASAMALDVQAAVAWLTARSEISAGAVAIVGASLGASLALLTAADLPSVRGVVLLSPALDYRGVRLEAAAKKYGGRPMLLAASSDDPYAMRTVRAMTGENQPAREQRISTLAAHGSHLVDRDPDVAAAVVDWLRRTLLS
jgi:alpha-beta hydrolase superfamily lysophospholipase